MACMYSTATLAGLISPLLCMRLYCCAPGRAGWAAGYLLGLEGVLEAQGECEDALLA
jgi:hypothetical protein